MGDALTLAAIDYTTLTTGLTGQFEDGVEQGLPIAAVVLGFFVAYKAIRRVVKS